MNGPEPDWDLDAAVALIETDPAAAIEQLEAAARAGDVPASYSLGRLLLESGIDREGATWWLASAAGAGHTPAMRTLGRLAITGQLTDGPDAAEALRLFQAAADAGDPGGDDDLLALLCGLDPRGGFLKRLERSGAHRELPDELLRSLGAGLGDADPELLFDAAIGLAGQAERGRAAFAEGAAAAANDWFVTNGADLLTALALD